METVSAHSVTARMKGQGEEVEIIDSVWKVSSILGQESHVIEAVVV